MKQKDIVGILVFAVDTREVKNLRANGFSKLSNTTMLRSQQVVAEVNETILLECSLDVKADQHVIEKFY